MPKYMPKNIPKKAHDKLLYFFLISVGIGCGIAFFFRQNAIFQNGYFHPYAIERLAFIRVEESKLLVSVLQNRMQLLFFLLLTGVCIGGKRTGCLAAGWFGLLFGVMGMLFMNQYGIKGLFLFLVCIFPQFFFYAFAFSVFMGSKTQNQGQENHRYPMLRLLKGVGVTIIGIFMESYVNPNLVSKMIILLKIL